MIYAVTAAHNRREITKKFIESLKRQTCGDIHLVLVDDGSDDGTDEMVNAEFPSSPILYGSGNLWWGGALHKAYKWLRDNASDGDILLISNDDTRFDDRYLETGAKLVREHPNTLVAGCGYGLQGDRQLDGIFHHSFTDGTGRLLPADSEGNCASTRSLFLTVGMMKRIGGFHPILLPQYFSDFEWTIRAGRKGFRIRSFQELSYRFDEGATGDNQYDKLTWRRLFGKRSGLNPLYRLNFVLLSTPLPYLPGHLAHQAGRYLKKLPLIRKMGRK